MGPFYGIHLGIVGPNHLEQGSIHLLGPWPGPIHLGQGPMGSFGPIVPFYVCVTNEVKNIRQGAVWHVKRNRFVIHVLLLGAVALKSWFSDMPTFRALCFVGFCCFTKYMRPLDTRCE